MRLRKDPLALDKLFKCNFVIKKNKTAITDNTIIEIGMGKGKMICKMAQSFPEKTFLGIEVIATVAWKAAKRIIRNKLDNVKILIIKAENICEFLDGQTNTIWITFPDPWPKKRHKNRRLINDDLLKSYKKLLLPTGVLKLKTDSKLFFNYSREVLKKNNWKILYMTQDLNHKTKKINNFLTDYEEKWMAKGKKIFYLEAKY